MTILNLTQAEIEELDAEAFSEFLGYGEPAVDYEIDDSEFNDYLQSYKEFDL